MTQGQAGDQEHPQSNAMSPWCSLRIKILAGVTSPHLPGCRHGKDSAGTLAALVLAQGQWLAEVTCLELGCPQAAQPSSHSPAGKQLVKIPSEPALPRLHHWLRAASKHLTSAVPAAKMGMDPSRLIPILPSLLFTLP